MLTSSHTQRQLNQSVECRVSRAASPVTRHSSLFSGHTAIELVGVLTILAVLAATATPVVIRRIDQAARIREINDLGAISNALTLQIIRSNKVSSASTWTNDAANFLSLPASAIAQNPRKYNRVLFIDTNGWLGQV